MAALALLPEFAAMYVITIMTTDARAWNDGTVIHFLLVANVAIHFFMPAIKLEFGAFVVIEIPCLP